MNGLIRWVKDLAKKYFQPIHRRFYIVERVYPEEAAVEGTEVRNLRVLVPAQRVQIASPEKDLFVRVGKYYRDGWFDRPKIFVCDIPEAYLYVDTGMVCTRNWKVVADFDTRLTFFRKFAKRKPRQVQRLTGTYSTVCYCLDSNYFHWMIDCLPKLISLSRAEPTARITLIMSETLGTLQRETFNILVPPHFEVRYFPGDTWLQLERFIWPSLVSGTANGFLPPDYLEAIRRPIFERFGLSAVHLQKERIYISRRGGLRRRVLNEDALRAFVESYGFKTVELDQLSFRQQVELFHRAEIVLSTHGAGLNVLLFCGKIRVVVLHPNQVPQNHFHTLACSLGQEYHFVLHHCEWIDADFEADIPALKHVFEEELKLQS
jgi:hypothetical protein